MMHKAWWSIEEVTYFFGGGGVTHQISTSHGLKNRRFESNLSKITRPVAAIKSLRFALFKVKHSFQTYLRYAWFDRHEMKRRCMGWVLFQLCDLDLWPHPWPWPWIFSCDQAALWMVQSICLSVLSVCLSVTLFDYVPIIVSSQNFQELLPMTKVTSMQKVKVRGQRSRSQR